MSRDNESPTPEEILKIERVKNAYNEVMAYQINFKKDHFDVANKGDSIELILGENRAFNRVDIDFFERLRLKGFYVSIWSDKGKVVVGVW